MEINGKQIKKKSIVNLEKIVINFIQEMNYFMIKEILENYILVLTTIKKININFVKNLECVLENILLI